MMYQYHKEIFQKYFKTYFTAVSLIPSSRNTARVTLMSQNSEVLTNQTREEKEMREGISVSHATLNHPNHEAFNSI
jgi:hypothetical protein